MQQITRNPRSKVDLFAVFSLLQVALFLAFAPAPARALGFVEVMKMTVPFTGTHEKEGSQALMLVDDSDLQTGTGLQYTVDTEEKRIGDSLVLVCTLDRPRDMKTLGLLADKLYKENSGYNYQHVTINWRVGKKKGPVAPWARTSFTKTSPIVTVF